MDTIVRDSEVENQFLNFSVDDCVDWNLLEKL